MGQMESVGAGRPSASYSCNMYNYKEKLGSIRKIGARADLIEGPAVYSLRTVISFFPTRAAQPLSTAGNSHSTHSNNAFVIHHTI